MSGQQTPLATYDPDWEQRWERANAALQASHAEQRLPGSVLSEGCRARGMAELGELHAAYHAQFRSVEEYRDHFMAFNLRLLDCARQVPLPHFPEGASLDQVRDLIGRFQADCSNAEAERHRPQPVDPPELLAFRTPARPASQRLVENLSLPACGEGAAVACRVVMEATAHDLHVCFVSETGGGSVCDNIERLATGLIVGRFVSTTVSERMRGSVGMRRPGTYSPQSIHFYDYWPWDCGTGGPRQDEFSVVQLDWSRREGFCNPSWTELPSVPPYLATVARQHPRPVQTGSQLALSAAVRREG